MTPSDAELISYCQQTYDYHHDNWGHNKMLSTRARDDNIKKVLLTMLVLTKHFSQLNKIYICHTSDSTGLLYSLKRTYGCEIVVLTNHPLFEQLHEYYDDTLMGINYQKVNCMFDNPFNYMSGADLVIFPDMEYYVPLKYKRFTDVQSPVCCTYYVDEINAATEPNLIDTPEEVKQLFSFKELRYFTATKTISDRLCYSGLGTL
jgi:hypothetical protein